MKRHPKLGVSVFPVIPGHLPPYREIWALYRAAQKRYPWIQILPSRKLDLIMTIEKLLQDENNLFVMWGFERPIPKTERRAKVSLVYSEAIGPEGLMLGAHQKMLLEFEKDKDLYDAVFGHTPWMAKTLRERTGLPGFTLPVGWDPEVSGTPDWESEKKNPLIYYGSPAGKRKWIIPYFEEIFGEHLRVANGSFWKELHLELNLSSASLYVAHSNVQSFSTWRIWQTLASSTVLIAEDGLDTWPMERGRHFIPIPEIGPNNLGSSANEVARIMNSGPAYLLGRAKIAHESLAPLFTIDKVIENYLEPALERIFSKDGVTA